MDQTYSHEVLIDGVKMGNNLILALIAGIAAAIAGSIIWMGITQVTGPESDYLSLLDAVLIGLSVRLTGKGTIIVFGLLAALLTLVSSFAGTVLAVIQSGTHENLDFYGVLSHVNLIEVVISILSKATPMTYIYLGVSLIIAFQISIRKPANF